MGVVCSAAPQCASVGGGPQMRFSLCIVLHNSGRELGALLDSVDAHLSVRPQIICVDSGSTDDGAALARSRGADVVVMDGNPGFGAANNAALSAATQNVAVLINPDCRLIDASLERLVAAADKRRALMAPRLLNENGTIQDSAHPCRAAGTDISPRSPSLVCCHVAYASDSNHSALITRSKWAGR